MSRNASEAANREPATPFAALLDSADPAAERPEPAERDDVASPTGTRRTESPKASSGRDSASDDAAANPADLQSDNRAAPSDAPVKRTEAPEDAADAEQPADASGKPQPASDAAAVLEPAPAADPSTVTLPNAAVAAAPQAVAAAQPAATDAAVTAPQSPPEADSHPQVPASGRAEAPGHAIGPTTAPGLATAPGLTTAQGLARALGPAAAPGQAAPSQGGQPVQQPTLADTAQAQATDTQSGQTPSPVEPQQAATQQIDTDIPMPTAADKQGDKAQGGAAQQAELQAPGLQALTTLGAKVQIGQTQQAKASSDTLVDPAQESTDQDAGAPASQADADSSGKPQVGGEHAASRVARPAGTLLAESIPHTPTHEHGDPAGAAKTGSDTVQNLGLLTPASPANATANAASAAASAQASPAIAVPIAALAVEIETQAHAGKHRFDIRLDPPELGRIDVRLDIDRDGRVTSRLVVDRSKTLDLLKRDAPQLERALQQAGLKMSDNALEFSLRQQTFARDDAPVPNASRPIVVEEAPALREAIRQSYGRLMGLGGGLDIHV